MLFLPVNSEQSRPKNEAWMRMGIVTQVVFPDYKHTLPSVASISPHFPEACGNRLDCSPETQPGSGVGVSVQFQWTQ